MSDDDFRWDSDESVVVRERHQRAIAVYQNAAGDVVLRQAGDWCAHEEDVWIVVHPQNVRPVIRAMEEHLALVEFDPAEHDPRVLRELGVDPQTGKSLSGTVASRRDATGASRSKRYRQRLKQRDGGVTIRDGVTVAADHGGLFPLAEAAE